MTVVFFLLQEEICITLRELNDRNKNGKRQQVVPPLCSNGEEENRRNSSGSDYILASNENNKSEVFSEVWNDSASSSNCGNNIVGRNVRHTSVVSSSSSSTSTINSCKKQTVNHPLPPPRKRNSTKQSPRLVHFMQSLRALPAWTDDDCDEFHQHNRRSDVDDNGRSIWKNGGHSNSKNGNLVGGLGSSNIIRERSVSVKELPQSSRIASSVTHVPLSTTMLNSSDFWSVNGGGGGGGGGSFSSASVCNLDFSSTESVNRWFSHMLAELDSIPNVSYTDADVVSDSEECCISENGVGKLDRHSIAGVDIVDRKLQEACSGLRDIGRFDVCSSSKSSSVSLCSSSSTQIFRSNEKLFNDNKSCDNDQNDDGCNIYDNNSICMIHSSDDKSTRSSYTWPLEQTKSSSLTVRNDDEPTTNGRSSSTTSTTPQPLASASSCEIYRYGAFIEPSETTTVINSQRRSSKDLTPTPSLDDIYSSVTPLASPDVEKKLLLSFDRNYYLNNKISSTSSSSSSSSPLKIDLPSTNANEFVVVKEKPPPQQQPPTSAVQKTDVATEVSNSLKMQHQSPSKPGARSDVAAYRQWPIVNNNDSIKPKKILAQVKNFKF